MRVLVPVLALALICVSGMPLAANDTMQTPSSAQPGAGPSAQPDESGGVQAEEVHPMVPAQSEMETAVSPTPVVSMMSEDQVLQQCLSSSLGLSVSEISRLHSKGLSYSDVAMAQTIAMRACKSIDDVVAQYKSHDMSWSQVANSYNVSMADIQTMPMAASSDVETFNRNFIVQHYGLSSSDVASLRSQGISWADINFIANASARAGQPVSMIASLRTQGMCWADIASRYNTTVAMLSNPISTRPTATVATVGAGPMAPGMAMYDLRGAPLLTDDRARFYYRNGYDWIDVAIAANVSKLSGVSMDYLLSRIKQGEMWGTLAAQYGVPPRDAYNVSNYPFARATAYSPSIEQKRMNRIQMYQTPTESLQQRSPAVPMPSEPFTSQPGIGIH